MIFSHCFWIAGCCLRSFRFFRFSQLYHLRLLSWLTKYFYFSIYSTSMYLPASRIRITEYWRVSFVQEENKNKRITKEKINIKINKVVNWWTMCEELLQSIAIVHRIRLKLSKRKEENEQQNDDYLSAIVLDFLRAFKVLLLWLMMYSYCCILQHFAYEWCVQACCIECAIEIEWCIQAIL